MEALIDGRKFTEDAKDAFCSGRSLAKDAGHAQITPLHIVAFLAADPAGVLLQAVSTAGRVRAHSFRGVLEKALEKLPSQRHPPDDVPPNAFLMKAIRRAESYGHSSGVSVDHLILGLLDDDKISRLLKEAGVSDVRVKAEIKKRVQNFQTSKAEVKKRVTNVPTSKAVAEAKKWPPKKGKANGSTNFPTPKAEVKKWLQEDTDFVDTDFLEDTDFPTPKAVVEMATVAEVKKWLQEDTNFPTSKAVVEVTEVKEGKGNESTSFPFGLDLVERAGKLHRIVGRDKEIGRLIRMLTMMTRVNPLLIGEPGVGKTAIVEGLAQLIFRGDVPRNLLGVRLIALDMGALGTGTMFEKRIELVMMEADESDGNIILFLDNIHQLLGAGRARGTALFNMMLADGNVRCIGVTTLVDYKKYVEKDDGFTKMFDQIHIAEPNVEDTVGILRSLKKKYEEHYGLRIQDPALVAAAELSNRYYLTDRHQPEKAIQLVDEACANMRVQLDCQPEEIDNKARKARLADEEERSTNAHLMLTETIGPEHIVEIVSCWTGIPMTRLGQNEKERLIGLVERLGVVGQDEAITPVIKAVIGSRARFGRLNQPIGSFLFLGLSSFGKTELAKALVEHVFDDKKLLINIDMSEYMEQHSIARFVGARPGYRYDGSEGGGQLTEAVRRRPFSVVLLDKVEKAHVAVLNTLIEVLDHGRLTDGHDRIVDFTNTVIIMTSNLGAECFHDRFSNKSSMESLRERVMQKVRSHFRPKLVSRLDKIVVFDPLSHNQLDEESCRPRDGGCRTEACQKGHCDHGGRGMLEEAYDHWSYTHPSELI